MTKRKKLLRESAWHREYCSEGLQNCNRIVESELGCHEVSREVYSFLQLEETTMATVFKALLPLAEQWIGGKLRLFGSRIYGGCQQIKLLYLNKYFESAVSFYCTPGLRRYHRGARLLGHVDHLSTHVLSAILNIAQKVGPANLARTYDRMCRWTAIGHCRSWTRRAASTPSPSSPGRWSGTNQQRQVPFNIDGLHQLHINSATWCGC